MSAGSSWPDRLVGMCVGVLVAAAALYCAARLIENVLPTLIIIGGVLGIVALIIGAIVVIRTLWQRW